MTLSLTMDRERFNIYPWYFADQCLTDKAESALGKKIKKIVFELRKGHIYMYIDVKEFDELGRFLFDKIRKDRNFYKLAEKNILSSGKEMLDFCESLPKEFSKVSDKKLAEIYNEYRARTIKLRAWGWLPVLVDGTNIYFVSDHIQKTLRDFLKSKGQEKKTAEYYSLLSSSEKMSGVQTEEIERLKLIKKIEADRGEFDKIKNGKNEKEILKNLKLKTLKLIAAHAKKFGWLTYAYIGPPMSEENVIALIKSSLSEKKTADAQIKDIVSRYATLALRKKEIFKELKLPAELEYLFEISSFFMHLKDLRKGIYQESYVLMDPVIDEIAKRLKLTVEETKYLTEEEIDRALLAKEDFSKLAKKRIEYCVAVTQNGRTKVFINSEAKEIIKKETTKDSQTYEEVSELKGATAFPGKVIGAVKLIATPKDMSKMSEGDILVSSATNPDLILAMKKAGAFVTDFGGITSHAAIVSREMKKPCVVGTRIATKVLKDGDLVEVDASNGTVKILKRAGK